MQYTLATLGLAALAAAIPAPQGVTSAISPESTSPAGCSSSYDGDFQIQIVNVTSSSSKVKRQGMNGELTISLSNGVLTDQDGRTGYIAANRQFQFDSPPQTGAVYTSGWSVCQNGSLAIGDDAVFQGCLSGTFYNLYDESSAAQCTPVYIVAVPASGSGGSGGQQSDGQPTASSVATQLTDGQPNGSPVSSAPATSAAATQISDGQPQAPTVAPKPVTQISDGQIQATTAPAYTSVVAPVTQISDGQPQAPTQVVSQISDGQIQAPTNGTGVASPTMSVQPYTGAAVLPSARAELLGLAAGILAVVAL